MTDYFAWNITYKSEYENTFEKVFVAQDLITVLNTISQSGYTVQSVENLGSAEVIL